MTVNVTRDAINVREKLAELDKPTGIAGEAMLRADTVVDQAELLGYRQQNAIINGDMQVFQRGTSDDTASDGDYTADRWVVTYSGLDGNVDWDQETSSTPEGFGASLKISTDASETSLDAADQLIIQQRIEGQNVQHFNKGSNKALPYTLSFWVRSSVASTYTIELKDQDNNRAVGASYYINQANTWEYKTVVFPPDTTGALDNDNGDSLRILIWIDAGSGFTSGTFSTNWQAQTTSERVYNTTGWLESTNPTFYITGVQLIAGNYPNGLPFMHRSYGEELALCQRYYYRIDGNSGNNTLLCLGQGTSTANVVGNIPFPVTMRARPSALDQSGTASDYLMTNSSGTAQDCTSVPTFNVKTSEHIGAVLFASTGNSAQGEVRQLMLDDTTDSFLAWSAEL